MLAVVLAGCVDVPQPFDLDHARVMAVRIEPPGLAPGERARIDVLVTDASAIPRVAASASIAITAPPGVALARDEQGWSITAPATGPDAIVALDLVVTTPDGALPAQKTVALGHHADNPVAPAIALEGVVAPLAIAAGSDAHLAPAPTDPALAYRWFSSIGELTGWSRADARLAPTAPAAGYIVLVVRDEAGGTAWTLSPATVTP